MVLAEYYCIQYCILYHSSLELEVRVLDKDIYNFVYFIWFSSQIKLILRNWDWNLKVISMCKNKPSCLSLFKPFSDPKGEKQK